MEQYTRVESDDLEIEDIHIPSCNSGLLSNDWNKDTESAVIVAKWSGRLTRQGSLTGIRISREPELLERQAFIESYLHDPETLMRDL